MPIASVNRQGVYWAAPAESESGWGIFAHHQGDTVFANWFTFGLDGAPTWMVYSGTGIPRLPNVYSGTVFTGTGPPFNAFDPAQVVPIPVGTATLAFTGPDDGIYSYAVTLPGGGSVVAQAKPITREVFAAPVPVCRFDVAADPRSRPTIRHLVAAPRRNRAGVGARDRASGRHAVRRLVHVRAERQGNVVRRRGEQDESG